MVAKIDRRMAMEQIDALSIQRYRPGCLVLEYVESLCVHV